jgi:phospho-N-acetylmuramoyl-pentapeptide-transferase
MLLYLLESLTGFENTTLRAAIAAAAGFAFLVLSGSRLIAWLRSRFPEPIVSDSPRIVELHQSKRATPTLGGLLVLAGIAAALLLVADLGNRYVQAAFVIAVGFGAVGLADDVLKLGRSRGLAPRAKLCGQLVVASIAAAMIYGQQAAMPAETPLRLDLAGASLRLGLWFLPLAVVVIVGASNAVNLADGLDGLAGGCLVCASGAMGVADYLAGHAELAVWLGLPHVAGAGEMAILAAAMIGAVLGFLWFNCHPAQVFMGDTGSLPLGALLGLLAVVARQEILLAVVGGVFVAEAASVIVQVGYFKWRKRRVFRCAPLHHHFQFLGWPESRIVTRFWIASALCALLGLGLLKAGVVRSTECLTARPDLHYLSLVFPDSPSSHAPLANELTKK